jgi:ABC-2 type transport system ATP-binding protein
MLLIEASHLQRSFGKTQAVRDVSLQVSEGEIYGLVGPDGAGKTTTIRLLCGALKPGSLPGLAPLVRIAGFDVARQTEQARANIGYLPQRFSLYEELTVLENIRFFAEARGLAAAEWQPRCMEILNFVGLSEFINRRAGYLSGGMKQKLGLAAALVHRPKVLLLDEPTTGVDPVTRQDFWQLIIRLVGQTGQDDHGVGDNANPNAGGTAVLISTPYMDEAARCTRIGFMSDGSMIEEGTPSQIRSLLDGRVLELTGTPLPLLRRLVQTDPDVEDVQMFGDRLHIRVRSGQTEQLVERLQTRIPEGGGQVSRLRPIPPQLEDVFMSLLEVPNEPG